MGAFGADVTVLVTAGVARVPVSGTPTHLSA